MANAKDCKHAVVLDASRRAIVAVMESLNTKTTEPVVFDTIRQVDGFYKICQESQKDHIGWGDYLCEWCQQELLGPDYSFEEWLNKATTQAIEWAVELMQESAK